MKAAAYVALLRAVNVGGTGKLAMADLRDVLTDVGLADVRTLLQSGNVVFRSTRGSRSTLERTLEKAVNERLAVKTDFFVRSAADWQSIIAGNPFDSEAVNDPARLALITFKDEPARSDVLALREAITGPERFATDGTHGYFHYRDGMGSSRLTMALIERKLRTRGTARNWNTVLKLAEAAS